MQLDPDENSQVEWHEARALPCPECSSSRGYTRVGKFRSQCLNCNALLKNAEVNRENLDPQ